MTEADVAYFQAKTRKLNENSNVADAMRSPPSVKPPVRPESQSHSPISRTPAQSSQRQENPPVADIRMPKVREPEPFQASPPRKPPEVAPAQMVSRPAEHKAETHQGGFASMIQSRPKHESSEREFRPVVPVRDESPIVRNTAAQSQPGGGNREMVDLLKEIRDGMKKSPSPAPQQMPQGPALAGLMSKPGFASMISRKGGR